MPDRSPTFRVRVGGTLACFTRPEFKVERVSYEIITPSAARGIIEAIHWKPAICWVVTRIHVLAPIKFTSFRRNEVNSRVSVRNVVQAMKGAPFPSYFADEDRTQRNTVALRDVDYVIEAHFIRGESWHDNDNMPKHSDMFSRRLEKGQTFHQPYLGCREFAACVEPAGDGLECRLPEEQKNKDLGWMLHDLDFGPPIRPRFFRARLVDGVMDIPPFEDAMLGSSGEAGGDA
jgi:CRISPR-associated protein Cas5d